MKETKHTAGPWVWFYPEDNYDMPKLKTAKGETVLDLGYQRWGEGASGWGSIGNEADARLMETAPELLEALEAAKKALNGQYPWWTHKQPTQKECRRCALDIVERALAKARGEQTDKQIIAIEEEDAERERNNGSQFGLGA